MSTPDARPPAVAPRVAAYVPRRAAASEFHAIRGLRLHLHRWGAAALAGTARPPLVLLHGWMDVGASFQFLVDALAEAEGFERLVYAPDWRGFGRSASPPGTDSYWFPDYLGDLDAWLHHLSPDAPVDLVGHSMGGNVAMLYAGLRPQRVRRLVNLEGFGMPATDPSEAPGRLVRWLDELRQPATLRDYPSLEAVADRLCHNNPRLAPAFAAWLAPHWAERGPDGRWRVLGDPAHKRSNPVLSRREETLAVWRGIRAPLLWVEGELTDMRQWWGDRYPRSDFDARLSVISNVMRQIVPASGHMLHFDHPSVLGERLAGFLAAP